MFYPKLRSLLPILLASGSLLTMIACTQPESPTTNGESETSETTTSNSSEKSPSTSNYKNAETETGTGNITGEVRWNGKGATNLEVKLCENLTLIGCSGEQFDTRTNDAGNFEFANVPTGTYSVAVRVFETDSWVYPTSGPISASEFEIKEGKVLETSLLNIYKSLLLKNPSPEQTIATNSPTLSWQELPEAGYYEVYVSAEKNFQPYEQGITNLKIEASEYTIPKELTKCKYTWRIEAFNSEGILIARSDFGKFSIEGCQAPSDE